MNRSKIVILYAVLLMIGCVTLSSCYTEQSLGARFVKKTAAEAIPIWFIGASYLFVSCEVPPDSSGGGCIMMSEANDSILEKYNRAFAIQLSDYGYHVYTFDEAEEFLANKGSGLIINIAQLELEEVLETHTDSEIFDTLEYFESLPVRVLRLNSWIEVSGVDTSSGKQEVFFATNSASDIIEGYFTQKQFSGEVYYSYRRFDMRPSLTGKFVLSSGEDHAQRLFDVWMNRFIRKTISESNQVGFYYSDQGYFHYNKQKQRIDPVNPSKALQQL